MNHIRTTSMRYQHVINSYSVVLFATVLIAVPIISMAKSNGHTISGTAREVHIANDGTVLVRGATVSSVSSTTLVAAVNWGNSGFSWTVKTDGSTEFIRSNGGGTTLGNITAGHSISFAGILDASSTPFTVNARVVKDWSLPNQVTLKGEVTSVNDGVATFVLDTKDGDVIVTTASSTAFSLENGSSSNFADVDVDDDVKVAGLYNSSTKIISAEKVIIENSNDTDDDENDRRWKRLLDFRWRGWLHSGD